MKLQDIGAKYGVRITILSGDVHLASVGRFRAKIHRHHLIMSEEKEKENTRIIEEPTKDVRLIFNIIASAIVNTPPPDAMATLLQKDVACIISIWKRMKMPYQFLPRKWMEYINVKNHVS